MTRSGQAGYRGADAVLLRPAELDPVTDPASSGLRDFTADESRTIPAYLDADDPRRVVRVFSQRFYAHAGGRRFVATQVVARQPSRTPDPLLMAARSRVLDHGEHWTPIRRRVSVGRASSFRVVSDHKLTTCSAVGGSRDTTTAGRELCDSRVGSVGSTLRLVVLAVQLTSRGRPCAAAQVVAQRLARVRAAVHHQMVFAGGEVSVSRAPGCVPDFNLFGTITQVWGADVVVHATSELTSVLPR